MSTSKRCSEAYIDERLMEHGLGPVLVARFPGRDRVEAGVFLVDTLCLGVKDAYRIEAEREEFPDLLGRIFRERVPGSRPGAAGRKLVEGAIAYARALGFAPHPDYRKGARVFGGIDAGECEETFVFGREGKPCYIVGPHDSVERAGTILRQLAARCGDGNYEFMAPPWMLQALIAAGFAIDPSVLNRAWAGSGMRILYSETGLGEGVEESPELEALRRETGEERGSESLGDRAPDATFPDKLLGELEELWRALGCEGEEERQVCARMYIGARNVMDPEDMDPQRARYLEEFGEEQSRLKAGRVWDECKRIAGELPEMPHFTLAWRLFERDGRRRLAVVYMMFAESDEASDGGASDQP